MEILTTILLIYGLIGIFYLIFKSLPTIFMLILAVPIFIIAIFKQAFMLIKNKQKDWVMRCSYHIPYCLF